MFEDLPKFVFFTGKGGVGKTSLACATAVRSPMRASACCSSAPIRPPTSPRCSGGRSAHGTAIDGVPGLRAQHRPRGGGGRLPRARRRSDPRSLPDEALTGIEEQLSGACTTEIAAFDEFTALLAGHAERRLRPRRLRHGADRPHAAPAGAAGAWSDFIETNTGDASCLGPLAGWRSSARDTARPSTRSRRRAHPSCSWRAPSRALAEAARTAASWRRSAWPGSASRQRRHAHDARGDPLARRSPRGTMPRSPASTRSSRLPPRRSRCARQPRRAGRATPHARRTTRARRRRAAGRLLDPPPLGAWSTRSRGRAAG